MERFKTLHDYGSHDWNDVTDGYILFRKDRSERRGGGIALYMREKLECIKFFLGVDEERVKSLWIRINHRIIEW